MEIKKLGCFIIIATTASLFFALTPATEQAKEVDIYREAKNIKSNDSINVDDIAKPLSIDSTKEFEQNYNDMETPLNNSFKSYMSYKCIKDKSSKQYKFQQKSETGDYGIRVVKDRFCIAIGSYYTTKIGKKVDLIMKNGKIIKCILGDCKNDKDTDKSNRQNKNGSIVEFIVDPLS